MARLISGSWTEADNERLKAFVAQGRVDRSGCWCVQPQALHLTSLADQVELAMIEAAKPERA